MIEGIQHKIGLNCLATSIRDIMAYYGYDYSEDFWIGLSGALSFWYTKDKNYIQATGLGNNIFEELAAVTKVQHQHLLFDDNEKAWEVACRYIDNDIPIIFDVELASYVEHIDAMREDSKIEKKMLSVFDAMEFRVGGHVTTMVGYDEDYAYLLENLFYKPVKVPINVLKTARNPEKIDFVPPQNGMHIFLFPEKLPDMEYLIKTCIIRTINNMELSYTKPKYCYARVIYDASGFKGIKLFFEEIETIFREKTSTGKNQLMVLSQILNRWGGNEVNRISYSRFLKTASKMLDSDELYEAGNAYVEASKEWRIFLNKLDICIKDFDAVNENAIVECKERILSAERRAINLLREIVNY